MTADIKPVALRRWHCTGDIAYPVSEEADGEFVDYDEAMQAIDALQAEVGRVRAAYEAAMSLSKAELFARAERAEAECDAMTAERDRMALEGGKLAAEVDALRFDLEQARANVMAEHEGCQRAEAEAAKWRERWIALMAESSMDLHGDTGNDAVANANKAAERLDMLDIARAALQERGE